MQNALYNKKRLSTCWSMLLLAAWLGGVATAQTVYRTGPVEGFRDGAKHYRDGSGRTDYECYTPEQTVGIADNVLLYQRANGGWPANWDPLRVLAPEEAVRRGDARILRLQVVVDGTPAVWAGQYDRQTLQPTQGRCFELPGLVSAESVEAVRCLMSIEPPAPEMVRAIEGAVCWFERSKTRAIRIDTIPIEPVRYQRHTATTDRIVVEDPGAPPVWVRFYEVDMNRPFMANRDGKKVYALADVHQERRTGYGWYTYAPAALLDHDHPAWRRRWASP